MDDTPAVEASSPRGTGAKLADPGFGPAWIVLLTSEIVASRDDFCGSSTRAAGARGPSDCEEGASACRGRCGGGSASPANFAGAARVVSTPPDRTRVLLPGEQDETDGGDGGNGGLSTPAPRVSIRVIPSRLVGGMFCLWLSLLVGCGEQAPLPIDIVPPTFLPTTSTPESSPVASPTPSDPSAPPDPTGTPGPTATPGTGSPTPTPRLDPTPTTVTDLDADGVPRALDCDDDDAQVYPGASEQCDGRDEDCDQEVDEGFDGDSDGASACLSPLDCDDADASAYPGAVEECDGSDNDCDGLTDEDFDQDSDGIPSCDANGHAADCDDLDGEVFPGATEQCDGIDNDCDLEVDEDYDVDGDQVSTCDEAPDCDDEDAEIYPGSDELCDGLDNDCDGLSDEGYDRDEDDVSSCATPPDCDDDDPQIYPAAGELCDGKDNDCDGVIDDTEDVRWYSDADGDGYGASETLYVGCAPPEAYVSQGGDCDDADRDVFPGATEVCDGEDSNCDSVIDNAPDSDLDGFPPCGAEFSDCNDADASIYPGAKETCDGVNANCDESIDAEYEVVGVLSLRVKVGAAAEGADGSDAHPFPTIMAGVGAVTRACRQVLVSAGTYRESIDFAGQPAWVRSETGAQSAILEGSGLEPVVRFQTKETSESVLEGFKITGGRAERGGGIYCVGAGPQLRHNIVENNQATQYGGGIYLERCQASLNSNQISGNVVSDSSRLQGYGGGIAILGGSAQLEGNIVKDNEASSNGGGIAITADAVVQIRNGEISGNSVGYTASTTGGGIYSLDSILALREVGIQSNRASSGGGIYVAGCSSASQPCRFTALRILENLASSSYGGGVMLVNSPALTLERSYISQNVAVTSGGGVYVLSGSPTLQNNVVHCNSAWSGGGAYLSNSYPRILFNTFLENTGALGGGMTISDTAGSGKALSLINNIIQGSGSSGVAYSGTGSTLIIENNNVSGYTTSYYGMADQTGSDGNISKQSKFVSYDADCSLDDDLTPAGNSVQLDAGKNLDIWEDLLLNPRPIDGDGNDIATADIGAVERQ